MILHISTASFLESALLVSVTQSHIILPTAERHLEQENLFLIVSCVKCTRGNFVYRPQAASFFTSLCMSVISLAKLVSDVSDRAEYSELDISFFPLSLYFI